MASLSNTGGPAAKRRRMAENIHKVVRDRGREAQDSDRLYSRDTEDIRKLLLEEMAWDIFCGVEPRLNADEEANFSSITGSSILDANHIDLMAAFGTHTAPEMLPPIKRETLNPTIPEDRWRRFLEADAEALDILAQVEGAAVSAEVPENFRLPLEDRRTAIENAVPDSELEKRVKGLTWFLISREGKTLRLISDLPCEGTFCQDRPYDVCVPEK